MKAKNILMTLLLVTGAIAAKASGYPPELALVSQPVMVYNYNSVTVYYDVENIGDYTYRGYVYLYLDPDDGYYYAREYVKVYPGRIKRIEIEIPAYRANPGWVYTLMPYYEMDRELYSFTTFEYFEPLEFWWNGPRTHHYIVVNVPPRPRYYRRPGDYRYYYDGYRPPMPPPGHGPGTPPPMDPMHHTYSYHHSNGGYPANHFNEGTPPASGDSHNEAPSATVRPKANAGSMSSGSYNNGASTGTTNSSNNGSNSGRINSGSDSGRTGNTGSNSGRIDNGSTNSGNTGSSSGRTGNSSSSSRVNNGSSSSSSSSSGRTGNSSSGSSRVNNGSSSTRSSGTSSSSSSSTRSSSSSSRGSGSSSTRSNSSGGRR